MFFHNFKYSLKTLFKNKMLIFWTFAFPIILGTFFNLAFSDIENSEKLEVFDIAIINNEEFNNNEIYKEAFKSLGDNKSKEQLFNIKYVSFEEADEMLTNDEIVGYLLISDEAKIVVKQSGINQTILKYVTDEINQTRVVIENMIEEKIKNNPEELSDILSPTFQQEIYAKVLESVKGNTNIKDISSENLSYTMVEFYTLIAMACLYGGILGCVVVNQILANMSHKGKRVAISPVSKTKLILSSVLASYITQVIGVSLLFIYLLFVLKVDFGPHLGYVILLSLAGCLAGLSLGIAVSSIIKTNENLKTGIIISTTMLGCFLSGMMGITMKYIVDKNVPIINNINPANMITDGFYSLYYYDTFDRFYFNLFSLLIFSFILIGISILFLRRQDYDSI